MLSAVDTHRYSVVLLQLRDARGDITVRRNNRSVILIEKHLGLRVVDGWFGGTRAR